MLFENFSSFSQAHLIPLGSPGKRLDKTNVDNCFNLKFIHISRLRKWLARVSKGPNENLFPVNLCQCFDLKTQQRFHLQD